MDRKKLLITGLPGVGKTTLVRKLAARLGPLRPVGFFTEEVREGGVRKGFEWVGFDGRRGTLAHVRFSSRYRVGKYRVNVDGFERFLEGVPFLAPDTKLVVIDEIGKMECFSPHVPRTDRKTNEFGQDVDRHGGREGGRVDR